MEISATKRKVHEIRIKGIYDEQDSMHLVDVERNGLKHS